MFQCAPMMPGRGAKLEGFTIGFARSALQYKIIDLYRDHEQSNFKNCSGLQMEKTKKHLQNNYNSGKCLCLNEKLEIALKGKIC